MPAQPHLPCPHHHAGPATPRPGGPDTAHSGHRRGPLGLRWRHGSASQGSDQTCVDVAVRDQQVCVRDSKDPAGPVLRFSFAEWRVFLHGVRGGEFELPTHPAPDQVLAGARRGHHSAASRAESSS